MRLIFIVNGKPKSGKTTFETMVIKELEKNNIKSGIISTIDWVKKICLENFWDGEKDEKSRKGLSEMKRILNEWGDFVTKNTLRDIEKSDFDIIFIDSREKEDIQFYKNYFGNQAYTLFIQNDNVENVISNDSDKNISNKGYDIYINNNGTVEELAEKAKTFAANCADLYKTLNL